MLDLIVVMVVGGIVLMLFNYDPSNDSERE